MENAFRVLADNYVNEESGTGVVHQAPYFGEDDYRVCLAYGIITKDQKKMVCPVDASGRLTYPVTDFIGQYVKVHDFLFPPQQMHQGYTQNVQKALRLV